MTTLTAPHAVSDPIPDRTFDPGWYHIRIDMGAGRGVRNLRGTDVRVEAGTLYARLDTGAEMDWPAAAVTNWTVRPAAAR